MNKGLLIGIGVVILAVVGFTLISGMNSTAPVTQNSTEESMDNTANESPEPMNETGDKTIVDVAVDAGTFTTLVKAVQEAGLVETLEGEGPFTVFAPTDEAFAKLPSGTVEALLQDKEKLTQILTYHVVPGKVMADQVTTMDSATTVQGQDLMIETANGSVMVNDATVVTADIEASNGVIHVIDTVLMPSE